MSSRGRAKRHLAARQQQRGEPARPWTSKQNLLWPSFSEASTIPGVAILPLRAFLAVTFLYAGYQKLADPGYFTLGSPTYIGTQMLQFSRNSPIGFVLQHMLEHAVAFGLLTILTELAIGFLVLLGLFTRPAAAVGFILNFVLFLSASWNVYPYFMGSDIVWCACWLTLALAGPGPFALDPLVAGPISRRLPAPLPDVVLGSTETARASLRPVEDTESVASATARRSLLSRREALVGGAIAMMTVILGIIPRGRPSGAVAHTAAAQTPGTGSGGTSTAPTPAPAAPSGSGAGQLIARAGQIPVNAALPITDPSSGNPGALVHTADGKYVAYDAVCTHAGCTVQYDPSNRLLVCPCHGGEFDPAQGAQVVAGPPPSPLTSLPIKVDSSGNVYLG